MEKVSTEKILTGTIVIWSVPKIRWKDDTVENTGEWQFELHMKGESVYTTGAVKVHEVPISVTLPAGINLVEKAIQTVQDEINRENERHWEKVGTLHKHLDALKQLTYNPSPTVHQHQGKVSVVDGVTVIDMTPDEDKDDSEDQGEGTPVKPSYMPGVEDDIPF